MKFLIADTFHDSLGRLDAKWQPHVKSTVYDFQVDPSRPSLSLERLHTREKRFWSIRVSGELRVIVYRDGDRNILCYVDHHDAAYQWAERHRMEVHPATGAAQLVKLETRTEVVVKRVEGEPAVFARYEDGYLPRPRCAAGVAAGGARGRDVGARTPPRTAAG